MGAALKAGDPAPDFAGVTTDGTRVRLADYRGRTLVLYFYPMDDTPGCTKQACSLRDAFADLTKQGVQVLGVSFDKPEAQKKFRDDFTLPYDLIADPEGRIVDGFGVKRMERGEVTLAARQAFLVKEGKIVWRDAQASTDKQAEDILRVLKEVK
ncbi:MAG TPA: peroxiredoxin [Verrucomicrobiales bacterium]|nr:peroxiredoxin [Verrucomicrobiales bacterium]